MIQWLGVCGANSKAKAAWAHRDAIFAAGGVAPLVAPLVALARDGDTGDKSNAARALWILA